jgi:alkanesulfonate monooxygenase SsuD/methylene tetrahydromethanopterin reductase-like flavin-dependent oxidoreductase (luciferase family)
VKFGYFTHVWGGPDMTVGQRYEELWRELELADRVGFDYGFSVEHHFTPHESWMPSPPVFVTGGAARTARLRLGPMGYVPALYNPLRVVEEIATLDHVTGGRLDVGFTSGLTRDFFDPYGADFERRKDLTRECVELLRAAAAAKGPFDFDGPVHRYRDVTLSFGPLQWPQPPLWIPTGDRATLRWLAEIGANTSSTMIVPRPAQRAVYRHYRNWWTEAGHPGRPEIGYWTLVYVADTDEAAEAQAAPHLAHTLTKVLGYGSAGPVGSGGGVGRPSALSTKDILGNAGDIRFLLDHNLVFVGSAATVTDRIRAAADEGLFTTLLAEFNVGWLGWPELSESVQRFGLDVVPRLAGYEPD